MHAIQNLRQLRKGKAHKKLQEFRIKTSIRTWMTNKNRAIHPRDLET